MNVVSICVPTYNGSKYLHQLFESINSQIRKGVEVVFCDDNSTDGTWEIIQEICKNNYYVKAFRNDVNLGMDRNFLKTVEYSNGKYIWFCGQDDMFGKGVFDKFFTIINKYPDIDFIYFNYKALDGSLKNEVAQSRLSISNPGFTEKYYKDHDEYFSEINHVPTFLPATVMKREFWEITPYEQFFDSIYVQVGVWLWNFKNATTYVIGNKDFIICRNPEDSWKYEKNPHMGPKLETGRLYLHALVYHTNRNPIPEEIFVDMKNTYISHVHDLLFFLDTNGKNHENVRYRIVYKKMLKEIFKDNKALYYLYVLPLYYLPKKELLKLLRHTKIIRNLKLLISNIICLVYRKTGKSITTN